MLAYGRSVGIPENLSWSFWVRHYDGDDELTKKYEHLVWRLSNGDLWVAPGIPPLQVPRWSASSIPEVLPLGARQLSTPMPLCFERQ